MNDINKKISVIIPVYNTEKYLRECLDSVLKQTFKNIEIIIVNDGSTDSSPSICKEYNTKHSSNISLITQENRGLSAARNIGLKHATGEYVMFLDSDDFWSNNTVLDRLVTILDNHNYTLDFIMFNAVYYYGFDKYKTMFDYPEETQSLSYSEKFKKIIATGNGCMSACFKIIKREFLVQNNIKFIEGIRGEDSPWFVDIMSMSNKFITINDCLYNYRQDVIGSITSLHDINTFYNSFVLYDIIIDKLNRIEDSEVKKVGFSFLAYLLIISFPRYWELNKHDRNSIYPKLKSYLYLINFRLHPRVKKIYILYKLVGFYVTAYIMYLYKTKFYSLLNNLK